MPVNRRGRSIHIVSNVNNDDIILADLYRWTRQLSVDRDETSLVAISGDALLVEALGLVSFSAIVARPKSKALQFECSNVCQFSHPPSTW
jgi:hypothetical protein